MLVLMLGLRMLRMLHFVWNNKRFFIFHLLIHAIGVNNVPARICRVVDKRVFTGGGCTVAVRLGGNLS